MKKSYETGIVILNYNTCQDAAACTDAVKLRAFAAEKSHIYIVDNGSSDLSGEKLRQRYRDDPDVTVLLTGRNLGFSGGCNEGIRAALSDGCRQVYLLNSDILPENDVTGLMTEAFLKYPEAAAAGPEVYDLSGTYRQFARKKLDFCSHMAERLHLPGAKKLREYVYDHQKDLLFDGMCSGCCFGLKADFIRSAGALDDNVFLFYEEDILAWMLEKAGKKTVIVKGAKVVHAEGVSTKKSSGGKVAFERLYRWTSALYVLKKYAEESTFKLFLVKLLDKVQWGMLSVLDNSYRQYGECFRKEMKRMDSQ